MNWQIVFDARVGPGMATVEQRLLALQEAQTALIELGAATDESFATTSEKLGGMASAAGAARDAFAELDGQMRVLASDRLQNASGAIDAAMKQEADSIKAASLALRSYMEEQAKMRSAAFASPLQNVGGVIDTGLNGAEIERKRQSDLIKSQMQTDAELQAEREKYVAFEQSTYNQLLFEQANYDAKVVAAEQKTAEELIKARESYVAFETSTYNQLLYEQQRYSAKVLADQQKVADRTLLTMRGAQYSAADTRNRVASGVAPVLEPISTTPGMSKAQTATVVSANQELLALQSRLTTETTLTQAAVEKLTLAYRDEIVAASEAGKPLSTEQVSLRTQQLKRDIAGVNTEYAAQVKEIEAAATAQRGYAASAGAATGAVRGLGNFYPLILQTAFWTKASKDLLDFGGAAIKTSAQYQDAFASVSRTAAVTGPNVAGQIEYIRQALMKLDTQVPASFVDLSKIATMGNEMGIQADQIVGFTKTVEQYATITGTSVENTANSLGAIGNILKLPADGYAKLASAISLTGRLSLASETEITGMTEKIAATAHQAGMTSQQIIGLAATLSSLKEAPERSQGALEKYFQVVNTAVADGGPKLNAWAQAIGKTTAETKHLMETNPNQFLQDFLKYLNGLDSAGKTKALADLGLSGTRVSEVLRRLSGDVPLLTRLIGDANKGYSQGSDLSDQFAKRTKTLAQQFIELQGAVSNLLADIGNSSVMSGLAGVVGVLKDMVVGIDQFIQQHRGLGGVIISLALLGGALAAVRAAYVGAILMASVFAAAEDRIAGQNMGQALGNIARALFGVDVAGWAAATGMERAAIAMRGFVSATIIGAVLTYLISMLNDFRGTMIWTANVMQYIQPVVAFLAGGFDMLGAMVASVAFVVTKSFAEMESGFGLWSNSASIATNNVANTFYDFANNLGNTATGIDKVLTQQREDFTKWAHSLPDTTKVPTPQIPNAAPQVSAWSTALAQADAAQKAVTGSGAGAANAIGDIGNAAAAAAPKVYTLVDYANDLGGVFKRAFDIKFGPTQAKDAITQQFQSMRDAANSAKKDIKTALDTIKSTEAEMSKTRADNVQQKYFLSVANQFGDSTRAGEIQGNIDTNNATLSDDHTKLLQAQSDLATATDKLSTSFKSNTAGAVANRESLLALEQKYQDYITALAASGADQKTLSRAVADSKEKFDAQAKSLGYSNTAIGTVNKSFDNMTTIIAKVPRNITVKANADPALQAINEFVAKAQKSLGKLSASKPISMPKISDPNPTNAILAGAVKSEIAYLNNMWNTQTDGGTRVSNAALAQLRTIQRLQRDLVNHNWDDADRTGLFYDGGYTGPGGKYQTAGVVHKGEYVVPANLVNQSTGLPYADALGRLISGAPARSAYANGGYVSGDMMVTELGPKSLGVLRQMVNQEVIAVIDARPLAGAVNAANAARSRR